MKKYFFFSLLLIACLFLFETSTLAQCAMCQATAETSVKSGATAAIGINKGVFYLFITPYLIVGTIGFFWWRAKKKAEAQTKSSCN